MNRLYKLTTLLFLLLFCLSLQAQKADDYRAAASRGDAEAQFYLGSCYFNGDGVSQDYKQAVYWLTKAANQGNAEAQFGLGSCYYNGYGVSQDYKQAVYWYTKAANQGDVLAQAGLGDCYYGGYGVSQDYKQAVYWFTKAANQGNAEAQCGLGWCYLMGDGVSLDSKQAVYWLTKSANQGVAEAQFALGFHYEVVEDYKEAVNWYTKAANQGDASAQTLLGCCYLYGKGIEKNPELAKSLFMKVKDNPNAGELAKEAEDMIKSIEQEMSKSRTTADNQPTQNSTTSNKSTTNTVENSLSKGTWRTQMRKVLDHVTKRTTNGAYKGQIKNGWKNGYGVYWWKEGDYLFGYWSDNCKTGYCIYIYGDGYEMDNCPGCVYFVGHSVKSEKGTCYDKYGNLIYTGDFSNSRPTGTYPTEGNYSSYKFECIEYNGGGKYIGETKNGKRHGQGVYLWKNGDAWYGPWEDDSRNGYGVYLYYKGNVQYGYSKD